MDTTQQRKYELSFLILTSLLVTLINNLQYYSLIFDSTPHLSKIDFSIFGISWYTLQTLISILLFSFFTYYWSGYFMPKKSSLPVKSILIILYNFIIAFVLFRASFYFAGISVGYPFGEETSFKYYLWKYIYITPSAMLIAYVLNLIVRKRSVEMNNAKLIEENLSNQLKTLKDQIKPHFLFNTLNTLSSIIRNESKNEGLKYVDDLAIVYRYILEKSSQDLVELKTELDFANSFLRLLKKRFFNSLDCEIDISDKYFVNRIPPLTLQLLIENAIKHNEISESSVLVLKIFTDRNNIVVENNLQPKKSDTPGLGIGLQNLNLRYKILTDKEIIINKAENKFIIKLPLVK